MHSVSGMQILAAKMADKVQGGEILLLYGELGSGKTTFVQGLAKALGIKEPVTSPTFTIVAEYRIPPDKGGLRGVSSLVHVDLYRLPPGEAASDPAVQEVLEQAEKKDRLTVIEWADRLVEPRPDGRADRLGKVTIPNARHLQFKHGEQINERIVVEP